MFWCEHLLLKPYLVDLFPFVLLVLVAHCHGLGDSKPVKLRSSPSLLKRSIQNSPFPLIFYCRKSFRALGKVNLTRCRIIMCCLQTSREPPVIVQLVTQMMRRLIHSKSKLESPPWEHKRRKSYSNTNFRISRQ
jgi:hypothetical protein